MNKQKALNAIMQFAYASRVQCLDTNENQCVLHNKDGQKCFIGSRIPDALYSEKMEDLTVEDLILNGCETGVVIDISSLFKITDIDLDRQLLKFWEQLQHIHDSYPFREWSTQFKKFAGIWGIQIQVIDPIGHAH